MALSFPLMSCVPNRMPEGRLRRLQDALRHTYIARKEALILQLGEVC